MYAEILFLASPILLIALGIWFSLRAIKRSSVPKFSMAELDRITLYIFSIFVPGLMLIAFGVMFILALYLNSN
jgi:hypothetical protein